MLILFWVFLIIFILSIYFSCDLFIELYNNDSTINYIKIKKDLMKLIILLFISLVSINITSIIIFMIITKG